MTIVIDPNTLFYALILAALSVTLAWLIVDKVYRIQMTRLISKLARSHAWMDGVADQFERLGDMEGHALSRHDVRAAIGWAQNLRRIMRETRP